jgi:Fe-S cluster biosynthesis and repair protein YggX
MTHDSLATQTSAAAEKMSSSFRTSLSTYLSPHRTHLKSHTTCHNKHSYHQVNVNQNNIVNYEATIDRQGQDGNVNRRIFSRVLSEGVQSWMKKTTYITKDYSRKVHDFKSLAKNKQEAEVNLEV